jgi:hypothetical protein
VLNSTRAAEMTPKKWCIFAAKKQNNAFKLKMEADQ